MFILQQVAAYVSNSWPCPLSNWSKWTKIVRGKIYSLVRPFYERAVGDLDRSMHRSLWI
jgi:hypothetical protein